MSKSLPSLLRNGDLALLKGRIIDVGCGPDPLVLPAPSIVEGWDLPQGDAQYLEGVKDGYYDGLASFHCLEHMVDVATSLKNWSRVVKEGGALVVVVPDFVLYERCQFPSKYNPDHKATFSLWDFAFDYRWPHYTYKDMVRIGRDCDITLTDARLTADGYDLTQIYNKGLDQTMHGALAQITFIYQKI